MSLTAFCVHVVVVAVLQSLDVITTLFVLRHGGKESNPLMLKVVRRPILLSAIKATYVVVLAGLFSVPVYWKPDESATWWVNLALWMHHGMYLIVAILNADVCRRLKRFGPCTCRS